MNLAKDKYGRIGRQIPGYDDVAVVDPSALAERRGDVYASTHSIEADEAYFSQKRKQAAALARAERVSRLAKRKAEVLEFQDNQRRARQFQELANVNPMNEKLKNYFARQMGQSQHERVLRSVTDGRRVQNSADFSSSGGNPEIILAPDARRPIEWRADFRQNEVVGNVLTRDGQFGPAVTDYDRYVNGLDVNEENIVKVAGGTMLGRYNGEQGTPNGMGFDFSWSNISNWASNVANQTFDNLSEDLPEHLAKELQNIISGGGEAHVDQATGQVVVTRPPTVTAQNQSTMGLPPWALYAGIGLLGVGVLLIAVKTIKS